MKMPTKRTIIFHGKYKDKYYNEKLEIHADSMFTLMNILFVEIFPELKNEKHLQLAFEDADGNMTDLFDPEQELHDSQTILNIMPNPDGNYAQIIYAIIIIIISVGMALLLAPKADIADGTASGKNWESPENVIGQGGIIPVALGERLVGSRVASYGIDATLYTGRSKDYG